MLHPLESAQRFGESVEAILVAGGFMGGAMPNDYDEDQIWELKDQNLQMVSNWPRYARVIDE